MATPWGSGTGGGPEAQRWYAQRDFQEIFGRPPTEVELSMLAPAYASGDKNIAGLSQGRSAIAQYFQAQENTPANQYARQQAQWQSKAPEFYGSVDQMFQSTLGRAATDAERKHFGSLLASGQVDEFGVGQFVQALPEAVQRRDSQFRNQLSGELQKQDSQYFNEQIMPGIQSTFAGQGRDVRSSGFAAALAQQAGAQNRQREAFLSNLSAQQYGGAQELAQRDYLNRYQAYQGMQDYSRQRSDMLSDQNRNRINEIMDYDTQARAYGDYLKRYGKRKPDFFDYAGVALGGIETGTKIYNARNMNRYMNRGGSY